MIIKPSKKLSDRFYFTKDAHNVLKKHKLFKLYYQELIKMGFRGRNPQGQRKAMFARLNTLNVRANRLPVQFSIIVPSTKLKKKISPSAFAKRVDSEKRFLSRTFGGDTAVKSEGNFELKERGKKPILIKERGVIVESSTTKKVFNSQREALIRHLKQRKKQWKQNSLLFKIEGETFIFPRQSFIPHERSKRKIAIT